VRNLKKKDHGNQKRQKHISNICVQNMTNIIMCVTNRVFEKSSPGCSMQ